MPTWKYTIREWFFDTKDVTREDWWNGRTGRTARWAWALYLLATLLPLILFAVCGLPFEKWHDASIATRLFLLIYGGLVSTMPHVYMWVEAAAFFDWSAVRYPDSLEHTRECQRFKMHSDGAKALWASIMVLYAAVLLKF